MCLLLRRWKFNSCRVHKAREDPEPCRCLDDAPCLMKGVECVMNESWLCFLPNFRSLGCTFSVPHRTHQSIPDSGVQQPVFRRRTASSRSPRYRRKCRNCCFTFRWLLRQPLVLGNPMTVDLSDTLPSKGSLAPATHCP